MEFRIIMPLMLILSVAACNKETYYFDVQDKVELTADDNDIAVSVHSSGRWTMSVSDDWFKITPKHATGDAELRLVAERNITGMERTAFLEFSTGVETRRVQVLQPAYSADVVFGDVPGSIAVEKGKTLAITVDANVDDWTYTLSDGAWLKETEKTATALVFSLDPSVKFDVSVPAVIEFTTPSDPVFYRKYEILPVDYFDFTANAGSSFDLESGEPFVITIDSNIGWEYSVKDGDWLVESEKTDDRLVFTGDPEKLVNPDVKAEITFTNPDYANFSYTLEVQPVATVQIEPVDKSNCKVLVLANDCTELNSNTDILFNDAWLVNREDYNEYKNGDPDSPTGTSYKYFGGQATIPAREDANISFTIDAGSYVRLSRFVTYFYYMYHAFDPLQFEVYAYRGTDTPTGEWTADWVKLGEVDASDGYDEVVAVPQKSYCERLANGEAIDVAEENAVEARYYRFKMVANGYRLFGMLNTATGVDYEGGNCWGRGGWMSIAEISMYKYID